VDALQLSRQERTKVKSKKIFQRQSVGDSHRGP
jgi:hypothetical protein